MQVMKKNSFNDGVVGIYKELPTLMNTDFNAKRNAKTIKDFQLITSLFYTELSARNEDFLFAEAMNRKLTMKIKTPLVNTIEPNYKALINNRMYDIIKIDPNRMNKELYIYLEGGQKIEK